MELERGAPPRRGPGRQGRRGGRARRPHDRRRRVPSSALVGRGVAVAALRVAVGRAAHRAPTSTSCSTRARASPREFETLSARVGGAQAVYAHEPRRAAEARAQIPAEVMVLVKQYDGRKPLIDIVEDSPFKPLRHHQDHLSGWPQLGAIVRKETRESTPLTERLAVRDWLLGDGDERERAPRGRRRRASGVTEAGRRAAEAYAAEAARRAAVKSPGRRHPRRQRRGARGRGQARAEGANAPARSEAKPAAKTGGREARPTAAKPAPRPRSRKKKKAGEEGRAAKLSPQAAAGHPARSRCSTPSTRSSSRARPSCGTRPRPTPSTISSRSRAAQAHHAPPTTRLVRAQQEEVAVATSGPRRGRPSPAARRSAASATLVSPPTSGEPSMRARGKRTVQPREKIVPYGIELLVERAPLLEPVTLRRRHLVPLIVDERDAPDRLGARQIVERVVVRRGLDVELVAVGAVGEDLAARVRLVLRRRCDRSRCTWRRTPRETRASAAWRRRRAPDRSRCAGARGASTS